MLHELGYEVALLLFPGHVAVGVECRPQAGHPYYRHQGKRYCYLETTGANWEVGVVPPSVYGVAATVKPVVARPVMVLEFVARHQRVADLDTVSVDVSVLIRNLGSQTARGATAYVALRKPGTNLVWDQIRSDPFRLDPEAAFTYEVTDLRTAAGNPFQVYVQVRGNNFTTEEVTSAVPVSPLLRTALRQPCRAAFTPSPGLEGRDGWTNRERSRGAGVRRCSSTGSTAPRHVAPLAPGGALYVPSAGRRPAARSARAGRRGARPSPRATRRAGSPSSARQRSARRRRRSASRRALPARAASRSSVVGVSRQPVHLQPAASQISGTWPPY